jgi:hypothetical protein
MKPILLSLLLIVLAASSSPGAEQFDVVTTEAAFLKVFADPRGEGLAGANSALADGISAVQWNPAGLVFSGRVEAVEQGLVTPDLDWVAGWEGRFAGASAALGRYGVVGIWEWRFKASGWAGMQGSLPAESRSRARSVSFARMLTPSLALGASYIRLDEEFGDSEETGNAWDLGAIYHRLDDLGAVTARSRIAAGVRSLGSFGSGSTELPRRQYAAVAVSLRPGNMVLTITPTLEAAYGDRTEKWELIGGVEAVLFEGLALRYGWYDMEDNEKCRAMGFGVALRVGAYVGVAYDWSESDYGLFGEIERQMLHVTVGGSTRGLDLAALAQP